MRARSVPAEGQHLRYGPVCRSTALVAWHWDAHRSIAGVYKPAQVTYSFAGNASESLRAQPFVLIPPAYPVGIALATPGRTSRRDISFGMEGHCDLDTDGPLDTDGLDDRRLPPPRV